jgi:hypothetical protein
MCGEDAGRVMGVKTVKNSPAKKGRKSISNAKPKPAGEAGMCITVLLPFYVSWYVDILY